VTWERTLRVTSRRHDLVAVRITDAAEVDVPAAGLLMVVDPESGEEIAVDTADPRLRERFRARIAQEHDELRRLLRRLAVDHVDVRTHESYIQPLLAFFRQRERKMRR
jgi:hypothetical protein